MIKIVLKDVLAAKGVTFTQLAKDTGISRQMLSALANNSLSRISVSTLNTLHEYLNVPISDIITSDDNYKFKEKDVTSSDIHGIYQEMKKLNRNLENKGNTSK